MMKVEGISATKARIDMSARRAEEGGRRALTTAADSLKALSTAYAPIDSGDLEGSHKTQIERRDHSTVAIISAGDGPSDAYALIVHENLTGQAFGFGERSVEKARSLGLEPGVQVGPGFLTRAFNEITDDLQDVIAKEIERAIG